MAYTSSNIASGFIDLATYDELERYLYGGPESVAYFVRMTRKSSWFTQIPMALTKNNSSPTFGNTWSVSISRAGDYLLNTWLRVTFPSVVLLATNQFGVNGRLRWTPNLMHNLIKMCYIKFNDLTAAQFDSYFLDFWTEFTVPAGKRNGYNNMIGNINDLTSPHAPGAAIPQVTLNLPLPFWYARDSGVALPTAAIPYNDMKIEFDFREWAELLILDNSGAAGWGTVARGNIMVGATADIANAPSLVKADVWATYAIVSNNERKKMGCSPREILIEQAVTTGHQSFNPNNVTTYSINFSFAIKALLFGVRNTTWRSEQSNYTTASPYDDGTVVNFTPSGAFDPIMQTSLQYENTTRLAQMGSDYYSLVVPYYTAPVIPSKIGYHLYSYALDLVALDPVGSTNYSKLNTVSIIPEASAQAIVASAGTGPATSGVDFPQTFEFFTLAVNNTVVKIAGGALGFPLI